MLWVMPLPANIVLRNFGLAMFLAAVGINAGQPFVRTVSETGLTMLFIGVAVLLTTVLIVLLVGYYLMKIPYDDLVGVASGATGNPAILVYSTRMAPTERPDIGYAMIFPSMTIVKVIAVQIVGLLARDRCRLTAAESDVPERALGRQGRRDRRTSTPGPNALRRLRSSRSTRSCRRRWPLRAEESGVKKSVDGPADLAGAERPGRRIHLVRRDLRDDGERGKHHHYAGRRRDRAFRRPSLWRRAASDRPRLSRSA